MAGTANIGKNGGIIEVTALTSTESNNMTGETNQSWLSIYETGNTLLASATPNTNVNSREAILSATVSTVSTALYPVITTVNCAWTITQDGISIAYDRHILFKIDFSEIGFLNGRPTVSVFCRPSSSSAYINRDWVVSQGQTYAEFDIQLGDSATITYVDMIGAQVVNQVPPGDTEYQLQITFPDGHSEPWPAAQGGGTVPAYYDKNQVEFVVTSTVGQTQYMQIDVHAQVRGN